jgi:predicted lipoprotein with Yx(FWY)xxD motif
MVKWWLIGHEQEVAMERTGTRTESRSTGLIRRLAASLAVAALIAACGAGGGTTAPPTSGPTTAAPTMAATSAAGLTLEVVTAPVGDYVAGKDGKALYIFTQDTGTTSSCTGDCATNWPPLVVAAIGDVTAGTGVTGALATITRDDGSLQVTLGGQPLYYFKNDTAAGQTNGHEANDVWFLAAPDGKGIDAPTGGRNY